MKKLFLLPLLLSAASVFAQAQLPPLPSSGFVTLDQIVSEFATQPDAALQKYNGQRIAVYGRVGQVEKSDDIDGNPLVAYLQRANNPSPDVKCVFSSDDVPTTNVMISDDQSQAIIFRRNSDGQLTEQRPFIVVGENVVIRGTFSNYVAGDVVLKDTHLLKKEEAKKLIGENK
ncbi:MAG: hypothetical protein BGO12_07055 [Verrucomicrobia bacterium 61-8]|nr:hypothetical protein [Verrucomicrobiota bacterium]OJV20469.1 MAG: hypothetical protein BGO12_07055 [Verrucomicrobia bacterium 61-8]